MGRLSWIIQNILLRGWQKVREEKRCYAAGFEEGDGP